MGKPKAQTIGYHYLFSLFWGLCRGPLNEMVEIKAGDLTAWRGNACSDDVNYINKPDLFGGEKKEGGIQGPFAIFQGRQDQVLPGTQIVDPMDVGTDMPDGLGGFLKVIFTGGLIASRTLPAIKSLISPDMSEMRGVVTLWFDGLITSMNPYPKAWKFRVRRSTKGWINDQPWYPEKAAIYLSPDFLTVAVNGEFIFLRREGTAAFVTFDHGVPQPGDTVTVNGTTLTMIEGDTVEGTEVGIGFDPPFSSIYNLMRVINKNGGALKARAELVSSVTAKITVISTDSIHAMNFAHMIYEACTNPEWGRGLPPSEIDEPSFIYAANRLCAEGLGGCIIWYRKEEIDEFIQTLCDYAGATMYVDRETGKVVLRLIRDDYDINDLPLYDPDSGLLDIAEDTTQANDTAYNEVIATGHDPISDQDIQTRAHNLAARFAQGAASTLDVSYPGIPTLALLARMAQRDMRVHAGGLKKFDVRLDRRAWRVAPGSVIRISHPKRGIANIVLRVGEIDDGNMLNGEIRCKCVQDVFGLPATSFVQPQVPMWKPPEVFPKIAVAVARELTYRDLFIQNGENADATETPTEIAEGVGFLGVYAAAPMTTTPTYGLITRADIGNFTPAGDFSFTANFVLDGDVGPLDTVLKVGASQELPEADEQIDLAGQALLVGNEIMRIDAWDDETREMTVARGAADTIPAAHKTGDRAWLTDDDTGSDRISYAAGEMVEAKVLPRTSSNTLQPEQAPTISTEITGRAAKPYPPADVKIVRTGEDEEPVSIFEFTGLYPDPTLSWVPRNRVTQQDKLVGHTEGPVQAEPGTTYRVTVYAGEEELATYAGISDNFFRYGPTQQAADGAQGTVRLVLQAERDGLLSQGYESEIVVPISTGYGIGYGLNYGGVNT